MSAYDDLDKKAEEEILNETRRAAVRASQAGALGWQKCPLQPTNKKFLQNTLIHVLRSNKHKDRIVKSQTYPSSSSLRLKSKEENQFKPKTLDRQRQKKEIIESHRFRAENPSKSEVPKQGEHKYHRQKFSEKQKCDSKRINEQKRVKRTSE